MAEIALLCVGVGAGMSGAYRGEWVACRGRVRRSAGLGLGRPDWSGRGPTLGPGIRDSPATALSMVGAGGCG